MASIIDIKPYITFIQGNYKAVEEDEFLDAHPELKRVKGYLLSKQSDYFDKEVAKLLEIMDKDKNPVAKK